MASVARTFRSPAAPIASSDVERRVVLFNVPWETYTFQALRRGGHYRPIKRSLSFPKLAAVDLERFLGKYDTMGESALVGQFRRWVRETMAGERGA